MLDRPALFKQDSVRRIDRVIDYFGGATTEEHTRLGASGDLEAPSLS